MKVPPLPQEGDRLAALQRYAILDTPPEVEFDDLTQLAVQVCQVPVALVSLLDGQRQWFKSKVGLDICQTPRDQSFCCHTVLGDRVLEVPDTHEDERFRDNPLVTGPPHIRYYAGAPLITVDGFRLGSFCIIDYVPRRLPPEHIEVLERLARQVVSHLEARRRSNNLHEREAELARFKVALDQTLDYVFIFAPDDLKFSYANRGAQEQVGYSQAELLGMTPLDIKPEFEEAEFRQMIKPLEEGSRSVLRFETTHRRKDGREVPVDISLQLIELAAGDRQFVAVVRDNTEQKAIAERLHRFNTELEAEVQRQQEINRLTLENLAEGVVACDANGKLFLFNKAARQWHGADPLAIPQEEWADHYDLYEGDGKTPLVLERIPLIRAFNGEEVRNQDMSIVRKGDKPRIVRASGDVLIDDKGQRRGAVVVMHDITEQQQAEQTIRQSLQEKEIMLKEIHHRVKNNLQVVSSLLEMQLELVADPEGRNALHESTNRMRSMAMIHEHLYQSDTLSRIDFGKYTERLANTLFRTYNTDTDVEIAIDTEPIYLNIETAVPCGLILNELIANALKHAFGEGRSGRLEVSVGSREGGGYHLTVRDTGTGLPEGFSLEGAASLGLQLVATLTYQLKGKMEVRNEDGAVFSLHFDDLIYAARS